MPAWLHSSRIEPHPVESQEIANRVNAISFNRALLREMRAVEFASRMLGEGWLEDEYKGRIRRMPMHSVRCDATTAELSASSKLSPDWKFPTGLRDRGRAIAARWLDDHFDDLGQRSTVDIRREFLE